jgi:hypothetical protein
MRFLLLIWGFVFLTMVFGQESKVDSLRGEYHLKEEYCLYKLKFLPDKRFELEGWPLKSFCFDGLLIYGAGVYEMKNAADIHFLFDSIPCLKPSHKVDSFLSLAGAPQLFFSVYDEKMQPLSDVTLSWGITTIRGKKKHYETKFFKQQFNYMAFFELKQQVNFLRFEHPGYSSEDIDLCKIKQQNYKIQVQLRPSLKFHSHNLICNERFDGVLLDETKLKISELIMEKKQE